MECGPKCEGGLSFRYCNTCVTHVIAVQRQHDFSLCSYRGNIKDYWRLEYYQVLLWYLFQAGNFLREMATHQAERYKKHPPWSADYNGMLFIFVKLVVLTKDL